MFDDSSTSPEARRKLAESEDTPAEILEQLSIDSDRIVRSCVAKNAHTSADNDSAVR